MSGKFRPFVARIFRSPYARALWLGLPLLKPQELYKEFKWRHLRSGLRETSRPSARLQMVPLALCCALYFFCMTFGMAVLCSLLLILFTITPVRNAWGEFTRFAKEVQSFVRRKTDVFTALALRCITDYADARHLNAAALMALKRAYLMRLESAGNPKDAFNVRSQQDVSGTKNVKGAASQGKSSLNALGAQERIVRRAAELVTSLKLFCLRATRAVLVGTKLKDNERFKRWSALLSKKAENIRAWWSFDDLEELNGNEWRREAGSQDLKGKESGSAEKITKTDASSEEAVKALNAAIVRDPEAYLDEALRSYVDFGEGFYWSAEDTEEALKLIDPRRSSAEQLKVRSEDSERSLQLLGHERFRPLYLKCEELRRHCVVFGSTGAGKTQFMSSLIAQAIMQGHTLFILDPKSDGTLMRSVQVLCELSGRSEDFTLVDLGNVAGSTRFNPIADRVRNLEIAERLTSQLPADGASLSFKQKSQQALEAAVDLLTLGCREITLLSIKNIVAELSAFRRGLSEYFEKYAIEHGPHDHDLAVFAQRLFGLIFDEPVTEESSSLKSGETQGGEIANTSSRGRKGLKSAHGSKKSKLPNASSKKGVSVNALKDFYSYGKDRGYFREMTGAKGTPGYEEAWRLIERVFVVASMNPDYYPKVAGAALPLLNKLTTGDLVRLFSSEGMATPESSFTGDFCEEDNHPGMRPATRQPYGESLNDPARRRTVPPVFKDERNAVRDRARFYRSDVKRRKAGHLPYESSRVKEDPDRNCVLTASQAIAENRVVYFSLHCLIDSDLGSGVGRLILSELRSVAGLHALNHNLGKDSKITPVSVFIDEASEVACESLIQLLNKSRSCGFSITLASQTAADWEASTGKRTALDQILGNCNTLVAFRCLDEKSSHTVEKALPTVTQLKRSSTIGFSEGMAGIHYSGTRSLTEEQGPLFPATLLMRLPALEYVARLPDGRVIKGRTPVLDLGSQVADSVAAMRPLPEEELTEERPATDSVGAPQEKPRSPFANWVHKKEHTVHKTV